MSAITLTTDFGADSPYVAAMKGVILTINPAANIVDITHSISPQDVRQGALALLGVCDWFPADTVHVVVVDPGVGTDRPIVCARIGEQTFIAPDNGVLSRLTLQGAPSAAYRLTRREFWLDEVSSTFHGRDIMAPVAAHLSLGVPPEQLGEPMAELVALHWAQPVQDQFRIHGEVAQIDSFGNLVTNIPGSMLAGRPTDNRACVVCSIYETWGIYTTYSEQPRGLLLAVVGSHGNLELAIVGDNAAERLGIGCGTRVTIAWD